jgi:DNA invertase Pin-like site-specific DNA recombinase
MGGAFCSYLRVFTDRQGNSVLDLEGQQTTIEAFLQPGDTLLAPPYIEVESGKNSDRPQLRLALDRCRKTGATLLIAHLDRLACSVRFISALLEEGVPFVACDMPNATPFMLHVYASMAEEEARVISKRTKARAVAKARGVELDGDRHHRAAKRVVVDVHSLGTTAARLQADYAAHRVLPVIETIRAAHGGAISLQAISRELNAKGVATPRGGLWTATAVRRALARVT